MTVVLALAVAPADAVQGDAYRLMYLHVPTAWLAYLAFFVTAVASALWLWPRTRSTTWDLLAGASAEVGVMFTGLMPRDGLVLGPADWGTWWEWDAPAHHHRDALLPLSRLPRAAADRRDRRRARQALRDRGADRVRRRTGRALLRDLVADVAPGRDGVQPEARRPVRGLDALHARVRSRSRSRCCTRRSCTARLQLAELEEGKEERELERAIERRVRAAPNEAVPAAEPTTGATSAPATALSA